MKITKFALNAVVISTSLVVGQLQAAPIDPEKQPLGSIGAIELNNSNLKDSGGDVRAYRSWFENGSWQGDLIEYSVSEGGGLATSIDLSAASPQAGTNPTTNDFGDTNWSAHVVFALQADDWWEETLSTTDRRKIITRHSDTKLQIPFRWDDLSADQRAILDPNAVANADVSSDILDYIRGDRNNEVTRGGPLRARNSMLGDIVHSNPEYVGAPEGSFSDSDYVTFKNANSNREPRVYVGANDGMLHAFNAKAFNANDIDDSGGYEEWAYLPSMLFHKLTRLAGTPHEHRYYVDGGISARDAKLGANWKTVLVGSLGAGGKGLYTLDITDPDLSDESTPGKLMDELSADDAVYGDDIGYIFDATTITQLNDGKWYAVNGNGIGSVNGGAKLMLVQLETGNVRMIDAGSTGDNGLAAPALLDTDGNGTADIAWAGDLNGDMWRFDLSSASPGSWRKDYEVFSSNSTTQPITQAPDITNHPQFGFLVLFATGKLYEAADVTDSSVQSIYGVWDKGSTVSTSTMLLQELTDALTYQGETPDNVTVTELVRTFNPVVPLVFDDYPGGWYVDLPAGERVLTAPTLRAGRLKSTVTDPDGFSNWFLEATFDGGTAAEGSIFDLNSDSDLSGIGDRVDGNADDDVEDMEDIAMAWKRPDGNMSQVTIASLGPGRDTLFLNFLNPPLIQAPVDDTCSGICVGGLEGGHMDVDTDLTYGGETDKDGGTHKHEYDIFTDRTYIDYFDIDPRNEGKPQPVTDSMVNQNREFIVLIANADWSPGGVLTIGNDEYNVVEYQAMLHKALADWEIRDGSVAGQPAETVLLNEDLTDPLDNPLVRSMRTIREDLDSEGNAGTLRITFKATALAYGGLIPSKTGCVKGDVDEFMVNDRWRGNALVLHLVDADYVKNLGTGEQPLDRLRVQDTTILEAGDSDGGSFYERVVLTDGTMIELTNDDGINGLEAGSPKYEVYGGLTAKNDESFIYESAVFWHWNDQDEAQPDICWANTDAYRTEFETFTNRTAVSVFLDDLKSATGFESFAELVAAMEALEGLNCPNDTEACDQYQEYQDQYNDGMLVYQVPGGTGGVGGDENDGYVEGQTGSLTGDAITINEDDQGIAEGGETLGPNFKSGRRTWIDIMSE